MTGRSWQIPVSLQGQQVGKKRSHLFIVSGRTDQLERAACGKHVNPGFAIPENQGALRCQVCQAREAEAIG
jgi:hypothetical protein